MIDVIDVIDLNALNALNALIGVIDFQVLYDHEGVAEYLIDHEADVTKFGRTLLHETAARDMPSASKALLLRNVPGKSLGEHGRVRYTRPF